MILYDTNYRQTVRFSGERIKTISDFHRQRPFWAKSLSSSRHLRKPKGFSGNPSCFQRPREPDTSSKTAHVCVGSTSGGSGGGEKELSVLFELASPEHSVVSAHHELYRLIKLRRLITRAHLVRAGKKKKRRNSFFQDIFLQPLCAASTARSRGGSSGGKGQICHDDYSALLYYFHCGRHTDPPRPPGVWGSYPTKPPWTGNSC